MEQTMPRKLHDGQARTRTARTVLYLRVSSAGQVNTDYDPEGLSLPAQRNKGTIKAHDLRSEVVREYVEAGVSGKSLTKRTAFKEMLQDIERLRDVDYVIVWSVSRWARNQEDYWVARGLINRAGAKLFPSRSQLAMTRPTVSRSRVSWLRWQRVGAWRSLRRSCRVSSAS